KARIRQAMPRPRRRRREASADLVLPLDAGLELLQSFADAMLDALVVARLEMQAVKIREAAPVAAVKRAAALETDRRGNRRASVTRDDDEHVLGHRARDLGEKRPVQVRSAAVQQERARVEAEDEIPVLLRQLVAAHVLEAYPGLRDAPPLATRLLALLGIERGEKVVEIAVAAVVPDEHAALARQEPGRLESRPLRFGRKKAMHGRRVELVAKRRGGAEQRRRDPVGAGGIADEQPSSGRRRERDRRDELRVIAASGPLVRVRPAPVEHELAVGIVLEVERQRADEPSRVFLRYDDMARFPGRARPDAARVLERGEELVAQERVAVRQRVPRCRIDLVEG